MAYYRENYDDRDYEDRGYDARDEQRGFGAGYQQRDYDGGDERRGYDGGYEQRDPNGGYERQGYDGSHQSREQRESGYEWRNENFEPRSVNSSQPRKKSLLIGINYVGSEHQLQGCHQDVHNVRQFISSMGYPEDQRSQIVMRDDQYTDPDGPFFPNGNNILAAMQWLVSEPGTMNFLHYSGHGGQVQSTDYRASGFDDTIVPYDFEENGQVPSGMLHKILVSRLPPNSSLFIVFDCCHSGSAVELPFVYRADQDGNVDMMDNVQAGMRLVGAASHLIQGGFTMGSVQEAEGLLAGAHDFFKGLMHRPGRTDQYGLGESDTYEQYESEGAKDVWMYSGCKDDQTSADANIAGSHVGAMSWAFLETMKASGPGQSYIQVLQNTRAILKGRYAQIPQLSVGYEQDLNYRIRI